MAEEVPTFDPSKLRKKKKPKSKAQTEQVEKKEEEAPASQENSGGGHTYKYDELLSRAYEMIAESAPAGKSKVRVPPPQAYRVGTVRTMWANFPEVYKALNRDPQHLMTFVTIELGTTANLDANNRLIIRGTYQPKQLAKVVVRYLDEYVTCKACGSRDTVLTRQQRVQFVLCSSPICGSQRSVAPLNRGYLHQLKRKRR